LGYYAGFYNQHGYSNVFLGREAGYNELHSDKLYIENSQVDSTQALIWGDFANNILRFNAAIGVNMNPVISPFAIAGLPSTSAGSYLRIYNNHIFIYSSSRETKSNIIPLSDDFTKILNAQPVSFTDKTTGEKCIGYIAEDFNDIGLNNLVVYNEGKPVGLSYELVSIYNLEIIKEHKNQIESQQRQIEFQNNRIEHLEKLVQELMNK
jgi:hypothetical protein